jgi:hypothetical protein
VREAVPNRCYHNPSFQRRRLASRLTDPEVVGGKTILANGAFIVEGTLIEIKFDRRFAPVVIADRCGFI